MITTEHLKCRYQPFSSETPRRGLCSQARPGGFYGCWCKRFSRECGWRATLGTKPQSATANQLEGAEDLSVPRVTVLRRQCLRERCFCGNSDQRTCSFPARCNVSPDSSLAFLLSFDNKKPSVLSLEPCRSFLIPLLVQRCSGKEGCLDPGVFDLILSLFALKSGELGPTGLSEVCQLWLGMRREGVVLLVSALFGWFWFGVGWLWGLNSQLGA
jgi:hypothetical protein